MHKNIQSVKDIAAVIHHHRKSSGLSQTLLAELAGVSRTAIQRIEAGEETVQMDTLFKVFPILNLSLKLEGPLIESMEE